MKLLTKEIERKLRANRGTDNAKPVLKIFNPYGSGTWLFSELHEDGDSLFGLCDLGMGTPEIGYASLNELRNLRVGPFKLPLERDRYFTPDKTLVGYADEARAAGRIIA